MPDEQGRPTCIENHPVCNASCCGEFTARTNDVRKFTSHIMIVLAKSLTADMAFYFRIHGFRAAEGQKMIYTSKDAVKLVNIPGGLTVVRRDCDYLKDCLCTQHDGVRPEICKELDWDNAHCGKYHLTRGCMFKKGDDEL